MSDEVINTCAYRFRTSVGGFHKGDVSEYIAKTAQNHRAEIEAKNKLIAQQQNEIQSLQEQLNLFMASSMLMQDETVPPEQEAEAEAPAISSLELEAYRRAEAAERLANQRAKKLYTQMEQICHGTDNAFEDAKAAVAETAQAVQKQAAVLDAACQKLTAAINASREELSALDSMIPDPAETIEAEA